MPARHFADTNLLVYRYSSQDQDKRAIAARLLSSGECVISLQVVNEFCNVVRKKFPAQFLLIEPVLKAIQADLPIAALHREDTFSAVNIAQRHGIPYYDALILACALRLGCQTVLSEDMQHGFVLDGKLTIVNPFILKVAQSASGLTLTL